MQKNRKITWVFDQISLDKHDDTGFPNMKEAALELGHNVITTKYKPFSGSLREMDDMLSSKIMGNHVNPIVCYGTIGFYNLYEKQKFPYVAPGFYLKKHELSYSTYWGKYGDMMLNSDGYILPFGEVMRRQHYIFNGYKFFIRPNGVTKSFPGRVIDLTEEKLEDLDQYQKIFYDELCLVAPFKVIMSESRHIVVNNEVIAQSTYRYDGKLDIRSDVLPQAQALAKEVARNEWQPDNVYVVDIAVGYDDMPSIIEFNSFSCAGIYACDTRQIIKHVSEAAWKEFNSED